MGKPSKNELDSAFEQAKRLIWQEQDQDFLAKSLFALHDQSQELTKVLSACEAYIRSGQSTTAHRSIISAMNAYRNMHSSGNADYVVNVTDNERSQALETAGMLRETGNDDHYIAKTVLNLNYRVKQLETVYRATERYLHSGMSITEHQNLENAIKKYRTLENRTSGSDVSAFNIY
ncbi:MAG: hypothetical protein P8Y28_10855 [Gammaproteobacteria bacterium]|jgi:hypothetical protein